MFRIVLIGTLILLTASISPTAGGDGITKTDCRRLHRAMSNQIETIYLVQMAEFWASRMRNIEINPGIAASLGEVSEALDHYDGADTRRAVEVILKFCPL